MYKLVSKIITARMAVVIGEVINEAQAGFIPGKHIGDNILLATELIKGYSQKAVSPRCMIKVDLRKAYDSIEWSFLQCMLSELGFPSQFITWIMECVTTVSYSILLNGKPTTPFPSKKGVRQGDPMSPFLFAIGMEYLSRCLLELTLNPNFNYHPRCEKLAITHMMFASDLLLFSRADTRSVILLYQAFQSSLKPLERRAEYSICEGLEANLDKSSVGGLCEAEKASMQEILGIWMCLSPIRSLLSSNVSP